MLTELLPGTTNVVRFPTELRAGPTLDLLREIAPDVRRMAALADALGVEQPTPFLRDEAGVQMAEWIVNQVPATGPERAAMLAECREETIAKAIEACRAAHEASLRLTAAQGALLRAQTIGGHWIPPLRERAEAARERLGLLLLAAHARTEEAEGVIRAIDLARAGEPWSPFDVHAATNWLIDAHTATG